MVIGGLLAPHPVLAERRDRTVDEPRIDLEQILIAEPQRLERAGSIVLHQHVGFGDELLKNLAAFFGFEVEGYRLLVRALRQERGAHVAPVERPVGAALAALIGLVRMLDLDHIGAQHRELVGRERASEHMGDVDDPDALERTHGILPRLTANRCTQRAVTERPSSPAQTRAKGLTRFRMRIQS